MTYEEKRQLYYGVMTNISKFVKEALSSFEEQEKEPSFSASDIAGEHNVISLRELPFIHDETPEGVERMKKWLREHKDDYVRLYHGTSSSFDIAHQGLLPTSARRRNSFQSQSGYVYLSVWPSLARTFGEIGNPYHETVVYAVDIKVSDLKPDTDQLYNKRMTGEYDFAGNTLADSIIIGHGARVRGKIEPWRIKLTSY